MVQVWCPDDSSGQESVGQYWTVLDSAGLKWTAKDSEEQYRRFQDSTVVDIAAHYRTVQYWKVQDVEGQNRVQDSAGQRRTRQNRTGNDSTGQFRTVQNKIKNKYVVQC